ncbi:MAG: cell division protein ZapE [Alphaproteobacteria bacterium]
MPKILKKTSPAALPDLLSNYEQYCDAHGLQKDAQQQAVLQQLQEIIEGFNVSSRFRLFRSMPSSCGGLYIHGPVGRGKSMLMNLFFQAAPLTEKKRIHFHGFMLEIHAHLHALASNGKHSTNQRLEIIATSLIKQCRLLCLDEMEISDIADAMLVGRLFSLLLQKGMVLITTSNAEPDALYKNGLQRELFLPFIALLKEKLKVIALDNGIDYRTARIMEQQLLLYPMNDDNNKKLADFFFTLNKGEKTSAMQLTTHHGRLLSVPQAGTYAARFSAVELLEQPLGSADFMALAEHFQAIIIEGIRPFQAHENNLLRRFILLVDCIYDAGKLLAATASNAPTAWCEGGVHAAEFHRTLSRLYEMQSGDYIKRALQITAKNAE